MRLISTLLFRVCYLRSEGSSALPFLSSTSPLTSLSPVSSPLLFLTSLNTAWTSGEALVVKRNENDSFQDKITQCDKQKRMVTTKRHQYCCRKLISRGQGLGVRGQGLEVRGQGRGKGPGLAVRGHDNDSNFKC